MATGRVKLVFDENFSHHQVGFVHSESGLGEIQHTRRMTWSGMHDVDWIPLAIEGGFIIVTGDRNDKTRGYTIHDLKTMGARIVLVGAFWANWGRWDKAKWLVGSIDKIVRVASELSDGEAKLLVDKHCRVRTL